MSPDKPRPRVLLMELELRRSEKTGRAWGSGFLGRNRVVAFEADEVNARGHRYFKLYLEEHERQGSRQQEMAETLERRERRQQRETQPAAYGPGPGDPSEDPPF
jgi:hypothetical protein